MKKRGTLIENITDEIMDTFCPVEGLNSVYYGRVRSGKTRSATADILELLKRGEIVYANWKINFEGYDERSDFWTVFYKTLFRKKHFYVYGSENFNYMEPDGLITGQGVLNVKKLNRLVGVYVFIDEGQWVLPSLDRSYDADTMDKMRLVLHGGHYCRSLSIITQRPTNISKSTRSQIHIWYRCVKKFDFGPLMIFHRFAIEDTKDDIPIEVDDEGNLVGELKRYVVWKKSDSVFRAYDTHAMRHSDAIEPEVSFDVYSLSFRERLLSLASFLRPKRRPSKASLASGEDEKQLSLLEIHKT